MWNPNPGGLAEALLAGGANPNARDRHGATPLHWAALHRAREALLALLAARIDINARTSTSWATMDSNGRTVIIPAGSSALDVAVAVQNRGVARLLREHGAVSTADAKTRKPKVAYATAAHT